MPFRLKRKDMTEKQIREFREYLKTLGSVPGLDSIIHLCRKLGDPQDALSFIHIAGTNGKGSVGTFLSYGLAAAGLRVGRFVSPVLADEREAFLLLERKAVRGVAPGRSAGEKNFEIKQEMISKRSYASCLSQVAKAGKAMQDEGLLHPTAFETDTALAFLWFLQKKCDIVVLECGMGGRLDSTNVVKTTLMEVITPISLEHTQFLGDTLEKIAYQKAGIIKPGSLVVSALQDPAVTKVLKEECEKQAADLVTADPCGISKVTRKETGQSFLADGKHRLTISLAGAYQVENAYLAFAALRELGRREKSRLKHLNEDAVRKGFACAVWPGRFQILRKKPYLVLDGAHNRAGARALAESVKLYFPNRRIVYIMGVFRDKDVSGMVEETAALASQILTVRLPDANRSMKATELAREVANVNPNVTVADSLQEALEMAYLLAGKDGVIIVFGSLSHLSGVTLLAEPAAMQRKV